MKAITNGNYLVRPFQAHKSQTYTYAFLSSSYSASYVTVDEAILPPDIFTWQNLSNPSNEDGIYKRQLYASLRHLYYSSASLWNNGSSVSDAFQLTGSKEYVINIPQSTFGEEVRPTSFLLTAPLYSTESLVDDGNGNITPINSTGSIVGNIFYKTGIAIIAQTTSSLSSSILSGNGLYLTTGSQLTIKFDATQTIYEHQILCIMDAGDFNYSSNPSIFSTGSVVSGSTGVIALFSSGTLRPYMTSVGAYNELGQLLVIGKFPKPVKRVVDSQQTVVLRFDI